MSLSCGSDCQVSHIANKQTKTQHNGMLIMWLNEQYPSDEQGSEEMPVRVMRCVRVTPFPERKSRPVFSDDELTL